MASNPTKTGLYLRVVSKPYEVEHEVDRDNPHLLAVNGRPCKVITRTVRLVGWVWINEGTACSIAGNSIPTIAAQEHLGLPAMPTREMVPLIVAAYRDNTLPASVREGLCEEEVECDG